MAGSVNKVILIGNLGKDPEVRYLESGVAVARFPLATSESYKDRNTGEVKEQTDWHNVVLWRGLAEIAEKYLTKGNKIYVEGKLKNRSWQDNDGNTRYTTEVVVENMTMLGKNTTESTISNNNASVEKKENVTNQEFLAEDGAEDDLPF